MADYACATLACHALEESLQYPTDLAATNAVTYKDVADPLLPILLGAAGAEPVGAGGGDAEGAGGAAAPHSAAEQAAQLLVGAAQRERAASAAAAAEVRPHCCGTHRHCHEGLE